MNRTPLPKAVVYPARTVASYGHIYSLGLAGIPVVGLHPRRGYTFLSRFLRERHVVPDAEKDPDTFVDWLVGYGRRQSSRPVLFMAEDLYAYIASANRDRLESVFRYPYVPPGVAPALFEKKAMYEQAERAGLRIPPTLYSPLPPDWQRCWSSFPALVKPLVSRFRLEAGRVQPAPSFPKVFGAKARMANNLSELQAVVAAVEKQGIAFCIQRYIPGDNPQIYNVKFVADRDSSIPACFISRKVRQQPEDFGTCCVSHAEYLPELRNLAEQFCRTTGYTGPGGMEFKRDLDDGGFWFIEVNPRLDYWIRMATLKGVNLPFQQYRLALGEPVETVRQTDDGIPWIDVEGDIRGYWWRRSHGRTIAFRDFIRPYRSFDEAVWNLRDPLPGLARFLWMGPSLLRR